MKFDYLLITLLVVAFVIVALLNDVGRTIVFDGKASDQTFENQPLTPRTWMSSVPTPPDGGWHAGNNTGTPMTYPVTHPNPLYRGGQIGEGTSVLPMSTNLGITCYKFVLDSYCQ